MLPRYYQKRVGWIAIMKAAIAKYAAFSNDSVALNGIKEAKSVFLIDFTNP